MDQLENSENTLSPNQETSHALLQSCALVTAIGVHDLFPGLIPIQGQIEENSFCYDFLVETAYPGDLRPLMQEKLDLLIHQDHDFEVKSMMRENAITYLEHRDLPLQAKLIESRGENIVQLCHVGKFITFCPGEVLSCFKDIKAIGITDVRFIMGYYPHLGKVKACRVVGVVLPDKKALRKYVKKEELARENDPVKLCEELGLLKLSTDSGLRPVWLHNGMLLCDVLLSLWKKQAQKRDMQQVKTPQFITQKAARRRTISPLKEFFPNLDDEGLIEFEQEEEIFTLNAYADAHAQLFKEMKNRPQGPVRFGEFITKETPLYAKDCEGLFRPKASFGDVQHIFCRLTELKDEIISSLQFIQEIFKLLGFDLKYILQLPKEKKSDGAFEKKLQDAFVESLKEAGCEAEVEQMRLLSGPRIEVRSFDVRGRSWLVAVLGIDTELSVKFDLTYTSESSELMCVLAQSVFFSLERVVALLVEKHGGELPIFLAPVQARIFPVGGEQEIEFARKVQKSLIDAGFRAEIDQSNKSLASKIAESHKQMVPFTLAIGEKEAKKNEISVRLLREKDILINKTVEEFIEMLRSSIHMLDV
jgi:threonyl-tRNA synthetase